MNVFIKKHPVWMAYFAAFVIGWGVFLVVGTARKVRAQRS